MTLMLKDKQEIVDQLKGVVAESISAAVADYRGLTVAQMNQLRVQARDSGVAMRVYRNTLARRAVEGTEFACLIDSLIGPVVLFFSQNEPGAAARLLRDFIKDHDKLVVKALALDGQLLGVEQLEAIAKLPSRDEALALLMSVMKAPVTKLVRTNKEVVTQLVRVIAAVGDEKKAA